MLGTGRRLLLTAVLAVVVAACGDGGTDTTQTTTAETTTTAAGAAETTTTAAETPIEIKTFPVGAVYSLTGPFADFSVLYQEGINLVLPSINEELASVGYEIVVIYEDSQAEPNLGLQAFTKLVNADKVEVVLIAGGSPVVLASLPTAEENGVLVLQTGANSPRLVEASDLLVNVAPTGVLEAQAASGYAYEFLGSRTMAIISMNNDFGIPLGQAAADDFTSRGGEIVTVVEYDPTATDFGSIIARVRDANPDVVYFASAGPSVAPFLRQARERGLMVPFLGNAAFEGPATIELAGEDDSLYWTALDFGPEKEWATSYFADYEMEYGKAPSSPSAVQADAIELIKQAILSIATEGGEVTGESIRDFLLEKQLFVGFSGPMFFPENGNTVRPLAIRSIQDGTAVRVASAEELEERGIISFGELNLSG